MADNATRLSGANGAGLPLANDLMLGADEIATFMFGNASEPNRRRVYHAFAELGLPAFKIGGSISARRSTIMKWIESKEGAA